MKKNSHALLPNINSETRKVWLVPSMTVSNMVAAKAGVEGIADGQSIIGTGPLYS